MIFGVLAVNAGSPRLLSFGADRPTISRHGISVFSLPIESINSKKKLPSSHGVSHSSSKRFCTMEHSIPKTWKTFYLVSEGSAPCTPITTTNMPPFFYVDTPKCYANVLRGRAQLNASSELAKNMHGWI